MNYYLDKKNKEIYAYDDEQLKSVERLNELEFILKEDYKSENKDEFEFRNMLQGEYDLLFQSFSVIRDNINNFDYITEQERDDFLLQKELDYKNSDEYKELLIKQQEETKKQLLAEVKEEIEILQDTIDFDEHDEQDEAHLLALKKYRVALNKVDTSVIDCEFPQKPEKK